MTHHNNHHALILALIAKIRALQEENDMLLGVLEREHARSIARAQRAEAEIAFYRQAANKKYCE